jgi:hypothetical protein
MQKVVELEDDVTEVSKDEQILEISSSLEPLLQDPPQRFQALVIIGLSVILGMVLKFSSINNPLS